MIIPRVQFCSGQKLSGRPASQNVLKAAWESSPGKIKQAEAKKEIPQCHAAAGEAQNTPVAQTDERAIGQSPSTLYSVSHSFERALMDRYRLRTICMERSRP
ncbi:putative immunity protein [Mesotoga sp. B105.6.4]|uniref:putative immunity protein n=1 Tax=Mesotoga sp. B105.6.4 TaxID=1582224 RepID=UPI0035B509BE